MVVLGGGGVSDERGTPVIINSRNRGAFAWWFKARSKNIAGITQYSINLGPQPPLFMANAKKLAIRMACALGHVPSRPHGGSSKNRKDLKDGLG
jgi:hypothetical protein